MVLAKLYLDLGMLRKAPSMLQTPLQVKILVSTLELQLELNLTVVVSWMVMIIILGPVNGRINQEQ
ncbi:hypothetical protein AC322_25310 [Salmonella enterica subsp. salamae]|nr:hypothetical protein [Salmonella enterica subsp. salamae]